MRERGRCRPRLVPTSSGMVSAMATSLAPRGARRSGCSPLRRPLPLVADRARRFAPPALRDWAGRWICARIRRRESHSAGPPPVPSAASVETPSAARRETPPTPRAASACGGHAPRRVGPSAPLRNVTRAASVPCRERPSAPCATSARGGPVPRRGGHDEDPVGSRAMSASTGPIDRRGLPERRKGGDA